MTHFLVNSNGGMGILPCRLWTVTVIVLPPLNQTRLPFFDSLFFDWTAGDWESRPFDAVLWHLTTLLLGLLKRKSGQRLNTILNHSLWWRNRAGWGQGARSITYSRDASQVAESRVSILDEYGILSPFISEITKKTHEIEIFLSFSVTLARISFEFRLRHDPDLDK